MSAPEAEESKIVQVKINGEIIARTVKSFSLPTGQHPYWTIAFEDGHVMHATGSISLEVSEQDMAKFLNRR